MKKNSNQQKKWKKINQKIKKLSVSPGVIGSSESVKPLPQSIFNHLFCFCQYSKTPSLPWDVNICQLAESPGHSSYCCWFFFLSTTSCVIFIDFYLTVSIFFRPKLPISISSPTNFCCKAVMETIFKTKIIFTRDLCSSPWGLTPLALGREGSSRGHESNKKWNWYCFCFCHSKETHTHHRLLAHFLWDFCNCLTTMFQKKKKTYATIDWKLMGENRWNRLFSLMFYSELKSGPKKCVLLQLQAFSVGGVFVS